MSPGRVRVRRASSWVGAGSRENAGAGQLSAGLPLGDGGEKSTCRAEQGWLLGRPTHGPTAGPCVLARACSPCLCFSRLLSRTSHGCHTKSALWGLQRPGHGPSLRGFPLEPPAGAHIDPSVWWKGQGEVSLCGEGVEPDFLPGEWQGVGVGSG